MPDSAAGDNKDVFQDGEPTQTPEAEAPPEKAAPQNKGKGKGKGKKKSARARAAAAKKAAKAVGKNAKIKRTSTAAQAEAEEKKGADDYRSAQGVLVSRPTARDVKIAQVSVSAYGTQLIEDAMIELTIGRRYGLIGTNGSGKSTLMKALAYRELPVPSTMDLYYLESEIDPSDKTALQVCMEYVTAQHRKLEAELETMMDTLGPEAEVVQDMMTRLESLDIGQAEANAGKLLAGLGFGPKMIGKATKDMSGGWRMRVSLAQALLARPTLLLLDEPTNHLDLQSCCWLEEYLKTWDRCLVMVSHSQDFLNGVCTNIIHLTPEKRLKVYSGNYDTYIRVRSEQETNQLKQYKKEQEEIKHIKEFIASCGTFSNLVKQAKSRQKMLDKMEARGLTKMPAKEAQYNFAFPVVERLPPPVVAIYNMGFSYSGNMDQGVLYRNLDLGVDQDSRIALVGPNGAGKSTLLKLICGDLMPTQGSIRRHTHCTFGRYHQHLLETLNLDRTPLQHCREEHADAKMEEKEWRSHLGRYGINGPMQSTKLGALSDGQLSRFAFSLIAFQKPSILLLDEPTNHLDHPSIDALATAINEFNGGMLLVSHDFRLIDQVAKEIWECDHETVRVWKGDIRSYKATLVAEAAALL